MLFGSHSKLVPVDSIFRLVELYRKRFSPFNARTVIHKAGTILKDTKNSFDLSSLSTNKTMTIKNVVKLSSLLDSLFIGHQRRTLPKTIVGRSTFPSDTLMKYWFCKISPLPSVFNLWLLWLFYLFVIIIIFHVWPKAPAGWT